MFPIRDHNPSRSRPYVTWALIAANIVIFVLYYPGMENDYQLASFWQEWAMIPEQVADGRRVHTVFTSMFLHAGYMHLGSNMLFLWIFGDNMEDSFGHTMFLGFYLLSGIGADFLQILSDSASVIPMVGASGAIAGVLGGYLLLFPKARVDVILIILIFFKTFTLRAWLVLGAWFGLQVFNSFDSIGETDGGVAHWAHTGGFLAGVLLTIPYWLAQGGTEFWHKNEGHPPHEPTQAPTSITRIPIVRRRRRR